MTRPAHRSLAPVDLGPVLDGTISQPMPDICRRDDGLALFYPGLINLVYGDSGCGKSWLVCFTVVDNARLGRRTMILDYEDTPHSVAARLRLLGMSADQIVQHLVYIQPEVPLSPVNVAHLTTVAVAMQVELVVIDSLGEAFGTEGIDENSDAEVGPWLRRVARPLAAAGPSLVLVDHTTKSGMSLHSSGSKRKRAAVGGASYLVEAVDPFVKGEGGRARIICAKDRHGNYRSGAEVGNLVMDLTDREETRLRLYASDEVEPATAEALVAPVERCVEAAVTAAAAVGEPVSMNRLESLMTVRAKAVKKRAGVDVALKRGLLKEERGPRGARMISLADPSEVPTSSDPVPPRPDEVTTLDLGLVSSSPPLGDEDEDEVVPSDERTTSTSSGRGHRPTQEP